MVHNGNLQILCEAKEKIYIVVGCVVDTPSSFHKNIYFPLVLYGRY
jgi:hypothetical protein